MLNTYFIMMCIIFHYIHSVIEYDNGIQQIFLYVRIWTKDIFIKFLSYIQYKNIMFSLIIAYCVLAVNELSYDYPKRFFEEIIFFGLLNTKLRKCFRNRLTENIFLVF